MVDPRSGKYDHLLHIGPGNIESFSGRLYDNVNTVEEDSLISGKFHFNKGDVIYGKINPQLGKYVFAPFEGLASADAYVLNATNGLDQTFLFTLLQTKHFFKYSVSVSMRSGMPKINRDELNEYKYSSPSMPEQKRIGSFVRSLDHLITLHQCKPSTITRRVYTMINQMEKSDLFHEYYKQWILVYKEGAIRDVTMAKYRMTLSWVRKLIPSLTMEGLDRITYQRLLNEYAIEHERQTTMDFHHQLKGAILDAVDEGYIDRDPTRKAIIKGKAPREKKPKYLNRFELQTLLSSLDLKGEVSWDWFLMLVAKTGMRFSEALALTPNDFDFSHQVLSINKTWDYKREGGFLPTKNQSSMRKIQIDWQTVIQFSELVKNLPDDEPIFVRDKSKKIYNSTINDLLTRKCRQNDMPVISIHGLRHTHASLLLFAGVSIASVARRLGHASMTTTQKTYLHIIQELENQDLDLVMRSLSSLN